MKKVGILTWHYYPNFGSALQAYALQEVLKKMGLAAKIIDYRNPKYGRNSNFKDYISFIANHFSTLLPRQLGERIANPFKAFHCGFLNQTDRIYTRDELLSVMKKEEFDFVICGSDQIWAPNAFKPVYMLDFVSEETKKISYAASIGLDYIPDSHMDDYKRFLTRFSKISVREEMGKRLLSEKLGIESKVVLDPTLLRDWDDWKKIEKPCKDVKKPFIFCYFLNADHQYADKVKEFSRKHQVDIVGISANSHDDWMYHPSCVGPREFIWLINHSSYVITDSYHGSIFSLLFEKPLIILERFKESDEICQNSRIRQLGRWFDIQDVITSIEDFCPE